MPTVPTTPIDPGSATAPRRSWGRSGGGDHGHGRRPALDGVRALAVLAVMIYHFGGGGSTSWLPGGFLGVDVFFVLSGYLITGLLLAEYRRHGRIDLPAFWGRRVRRLMPALIVVLLAVCAWVWWASAPDSYPSRREDVFWTLGYLANWHLLATSETYFAAYTGASPLRHAWSLAVEEQFYLVWPTLVLLLMRFGGPAVRRLPGLSRLGTVGRAEAMVAAFAVVGIVFSFAWMADAYSALAPSRAYYGTQGRVQELFVGVLLAVLLPRAGRWRPGRTTSVEDGGDVQPADPGRRRRPSTGGIGAIGAVGLAALFVAFFTLPDDAVYYYRGGGLLACLAAAALLAAVELRPQGRLGRLFSWQPAVVLGRISYGVYLWHWPLVVAIPVTAGMSTGEQLVRQALRLLITLAAAALSYRLVEQPIQRSRSLRSPRRVAVGAVAACALVVAAAVPATALPAGVAEQLKHRSDRSCPGERPDLLVTCTWPSGAEPATRPVKLALLGDSTARALSRGLDEWADRTGSTWAQAAFMRCSATGLPVLPNNLPELDLPARVCTAQAPGRIRDVLDRDRPPVVLVSEFWISFQSIVLDDGSLVKPGTAEHAAVLEKAYLALVDEVAQRGGHTVFLELPPPGESIGRSLAATRPAGDARGTPAGGGVFVESFNTVLRSVAAARPDDAGTVSVTDVICPGGRCAALQGGTVVRVDGVHYSIPFARRLTPILMSRVDAAVAG